MTNELFYVIINLEGDNMTLTEFHTMIGETIMFCQTIENDLKWIYLL